MSPERCPKAGPAAGFPRVSGDEPLVQLNLEELCEFSPRERG